MTLPVTLPSSIVKNLIYAAQHKDNEIVFSGKQARKILDYSGIEWLPEVEKGSDQKEALRNFKKAIRHRYGSRTKFYLDKSREETDDGVEQIVTLTIDDDESTAMLEYDTVHSVFKASGLSAYFHMSSATRMETHPK